MTRSRTSTVPEDPQRRVQIQEPFLDLIRSMKDEFNFAYDCIRSLINEEDDPEAWSTVYTIPPPVDPPLFTANVKRAVHRLVAEDLWPVISVALDRWFPTKRLTTEDSRILLDMFVADFLTTPFDAKAFLAFCSTAAELSAFSFFAGAEYAGEYGMGSIVYVVKACVDDGRIGTGFWAVLDAAAAEVVAREGDAETDYLKTLQHRRNVLLIDYDDSTVDDGDNE